MYTTIIHPIRRALNIGPLDYCVLDSVYRLSKNVKFGGWCVMSKKQMADDLCISERAIFKILKTLEEKELIEKNEFGHLRTKDLWNELVANTHDYYIAFNGKESQFVSGKLPPQPQTAQIAEGYAQNAEPMNKVHDTYEQSSYNNNKTIISNNNINKERGRFAPPSLLEIQNYCKERNSVVDAESFWNFYESKGWRVGAQPMKSWRAAIVTWEKRSLPQGSGAPPPKIYKYNGREISKEEFDRIKN